MNPYVTFRDTDSQGELRYYVLQRQYPNFVGVIMERPNPDSLACVPISGHNLWVHFAGTIQGMYIPLSLNMRQEIETAFMDMASWYSVNRVFANPGKYKKFKINTASNTEQPYRED